MRISKDIIGMPLISVDEGVNLGVVKDIYFNIALNALAGVYLGSDGLIKRKSRFIDAKDVILLGEDVVLVRRTDASEISETNVANEEWIRRSQLIGREIQTAGNTLIGSIGDIYLGPMGQVRALALAKAQIESPVASAGLIMRDAILEIGEGDSPIIVDLSVAERQSMTPEISDIIS